MFLQRPGSLRPIFHVDLGSVPEEGIDIVIVPAVNGIYPIDKYRHQCPWVKPLTDATNIDTRVFLFDFDLQHDESSLWDQLLHQGKALIDSLEHVRRAKYAERPLLFISHSLGGLVVKSALSNAKQWHRDVTSGLIFLGTPHLISPASQGWESLQFIMKGDKKDIPKHNMNDDERDRVAMVCQAFEELPLQIPILAAFEKKGTKIRNKFFSRTSSKNSSLLVPESMASFATARMFGIDKNHYELIDVEEESDFFKRLRQFFANFADYAPGNVQKILNPLQNVELEKFGTTTQAQPASFEEERPQMEYLDKIVSKNGMIELPFSYNGSTAKNDEYVDQVNALDKIDSAFGLTQLSENKWKRQDHVPSTTPKSFALCGMGGIGKTETAMEYFYSRRQQFDVLIWIYADTATKLAAQFMAIAKALSQESTAACDEAETREIVRKWLLSPRAYKVEDGQHVEVSNVTSLFVFDNADDPDLLHEWFPDHCGSCVLITSRYPLTTEDSYGLGRGLHLDPMSSEVGSALLRKLARRENEKDAVEASTHIVELLGGLPLAIFQMSAIIRWQHLTLSDFQRWYEEDPRGLHELKARGFKSEYGNTIATVWAVDRLDKGALALLQVLAVLDPDRIPEDMLKSSDSQPPLLDYPFKASVYFNARAQLIHSSLITRNMGKNELHVHRLILEVVRSRMTATTRHKVYATVSLLINNKWPFVCGTDPTRNQSWRIPIAERYTPHICQVEAIYGDSIRDGTYDGTADSGFLFCSYAWYASERGQPTQTIAFAELARLILQKALKTVSDKQKEAEIVHWLGEAHHNLSLAGVTTNKTDGMHDVQEWIKILKDHSQSLGSSKVQLCLATAYNQLGICYMGNKEVEPAMESFRKSLLAYDKMENAPRFSGTFPANSLARLHLVKGEPDKADEVLTPKLVEHETILGKDDTTTTESGHTWLNMGQIRTAQQRYPEALEFYQRALRNMKATLGEKHYFTGDCFYKLAMALAAEEEDLEKTLSYLDSALEAFFAGSHREAQAARALWQKGRLLRSLGDVAASDKLWERAMELRRQLRPDDMRGIADLDEADWTEPILYWSK